MVRISLFMIAVPLFVAACDDSDSGPSGEELYNGTAEDARWGALEAYLQSMSDPAVTAPNSLAPEHVLSGSATAFVCERRICRTPTSDPAELARQLARVTPLLTDRTPDGIR
jgi:uncharacterized protein YyaL (SSP411 family)